MISPRSIEEVLHRADIVEVIGQFVRLKKRGSNHIANCPFHQEKTPSFSVSGTKGIFKCFGCGQGGNVVSFLQEHEKLSYPEAIRWLAQYYQIPLEETERSPDQEKQHFAEESLRILNEFAAEVFHRQLLEDPEGRAVGLSYFQERGFRPETLVKFRLGYGRRERDHFFRLATEKGYDRDLMIQAGLVKQRGDLWTDSYRERVIFPIQGLSGKVLGFGARILGQHDRAPKYVNTPENALYVKSRILYGIYQARAAISRQDECLLVEGYTDVISLHQGGMENVVASSGTALTADQLRLVGRLTRNLTILYDGDKAGVKAAIRGLDMALSQGFRVNLVLFPEGQDPDSCLKAWGAERFRHYLQTHKVDAIGFRLQVGEEELGQDPIKKNKLINEMAETISYIDRAEDFALQGHYAREASLRLGIDEQGFLNLINKYIRDRIRKESRNHQREEVPEVLPVGETGELPVESLGDGLGTREEEEQEWDLIRVLIEHGDQPMREEGLVADFIFQSVDPELIASREVSGLFRQYFQYREEKGSSPPLTYFSNHPKAAIRERMATLLHERHQISPNWRQVYGIESMHAEPPYLMEVESSLIYFEIRKLKKIQRELLEAMRQEKDERKLMHMIRRQMELKETEAEILRRLGTVIVKQNPS